MPEKKKVYGSGRCCCRNCNNIAVLYFEFISDGSRFWVGSCGSCERINKRFILRRFSVQEEIRLIDRKLNHRGGRILKGRIEVIS